MRRFNHILAILLVLFFAIFVYLLVTGISTRDFWILLAILVVWSLYLTLIADNKPSHPQTKDREEIK